LDTICYIVAYNQYIINDNKTYEFQVRSHVREFISNILLATNSDLTSMVYQNKVHDNFRKYFYPDYKSKRPPKPDFLVCWGEVILDEFKNLGAVGVNIIESDDVLNIGYHRFKTKYELVIVSADKDLNQIPGEHYNPKKNLGYFVTEEAAMYNKLVQLLMGDNVDSIKGLEGVGIKTSEKYLEVLKTENALTNTIRCEQHLQDIYREFYTDNWYSEYLKTRFLVLLLKEINYELYPFNLEVKELFNVIERKNLVKNNLFV
jgi:5'-3' exonuclease